MADVGRPKVVDDDVLHKLKEAFLLGCSDEEAAFYANISTSTLYNYQKDNEEFLEDKNQWKQNPILLARQEVVAGLKDNPSHSLKFLERKKKDEFGVNLDLTSGGEPVKALVEFIGEPNKSGEENAK